VEQGPPRASAIVFTGPGLPCRRRWNPGVVARPAAPRRFIVVRRFAHPLKLRIIRVPAGLRVHL